MTPLQLAAHFFLQAAIIIAVCLGFGYLARKYLGQTQVVAEMIVGVILGPSLFGLLLPNVQVALFPTKLASGGMHPTMQVLYVVSQLGLVLYMFVIGLELDINRLKGHQKGTTAVAAAGILFPLIMGGLASLALQPKFELFVDGVGTWQAAFFLGAAMCITAFPMLARIIKETGLTETAMGTVAIVSAAINDVFSWILLAIVLTQVNNDIVHAAMALGGGAVFFLVAWFLAKPVLAKVIPSKLEDFGDHHLSIILVGLLVSAWITDSIQIYAVFGAFVFGMVVPKNEATANVANRLTQLTTILLLPFFFVYSGLNTQVGLLNSPTLWGIALLITVVAFVGKGLGCLLAAKVTGQTWADATKIGTLMNARGLMELIIINIGLEHGVITPTLYTMLVLMAIVTTVTASPLFRILQKRWPDQAIPAA